MKEKKRYRLLAVTIITLLLAVNLIGFSNASDEKKVVYAAAYPKEVAPSVDTVLKNVSTYMLYKDTNPDYSSIWNVIGMVRSGITVPQSYTDDFYKNVLAYMNENNWDLNTRKYSDYSKLILAVTAVGIDAEDMDGHNLLYYLSDFVNVRTQGFNGPIWALIALDCHGNDYEIPLNSSAKDQNSRDKMIEYLLKPGYMKPEGGWSLYNDSSAEPDVDITAMTIQALAPYYANRDDVKNAVDKGLNWLSSVQMTNGGYATMGIETSESNAQVIVALCTLGINPGKDERFVVSNGNWTLSRLFEYYMAENTSMGGFMHVQAGAQNNGGGEAGKINGMATEQGMYATASYRRLLEGKTALYDMSDISITSKKSEDSPNVPPTTEKKENTTQAAPKIKVSKISLDYSQIGILKSQTKTLKATVLPASATNKNVTWKSSNTKVATVTQSGVVKGIKKGTATITVTAKDGSEAKASCTVKVTEASGKTVNPATGTTRKQVTTGSVKTGNAQQAGGVTKGGGNVSTTGNKSQGQGDSEEASTQAGWSFDGADYVPENYESDDSAEDIPNNNDTDIAVEDNGQKKVIDWDGKNLTISIPLGPLAYILLGMAILGGIEGIIFLVRKNKKHEQE